MSVVTTVIIVGDLTDEQFFLLSRYSWENHTLDISKVPWEVFGGSKINEVDVYMSAVNHLPIGDFIYFLEENFKGAEMTVILHSYNLNYKCIWQSDLTHTTYNVYVLER